MTDAPLDRHRTAATLGVGRPVRGAAELAELMGGHRAVVLCLTGSWCGSCSAFDPVFAGIAGEWAEHDDVAWAVADTQVATDLAAALAVRTVPTTLVLAGGRVVDRIDGPVTRRALRQRVHSALEEAPPVPSPSPPDVA